MAMETFVARINLFGFTWGTILNLAFGLSGTLQYRSGYGHPAQDYAPSRLLSTLLFGELLAFCFGVALAIPYALAFRYVERKCSSRRINFRLNSVAVSALFCLPVLLWYVLWPGSEYGPDGWFSGGLRIGLAGYVAALAAGFVAGKPRTPIKDQHHHPGSALVLAVELVFVFGFITAAVFPTFQKVRGSGVAATQINFNKTNVSLLTRVYPSSVPWAVGISELRISIRGLLS